MVSISIDYKYNFLKFKIAIIFIAASQQLQFFPLHPVFSAQTGGRLIMIRMINDHEEDDHLDDSDNHGANFISIAKRA